MDNHEDPLPATTIVDQAQARVDAAAPLFDAGYYRAARPDLDGTDFDLLLHYVLHGWHEGAPAQPLFDAEYYVWKLGALLPEGTDPLGHYAQIGWQGGTPPHPLFDPAYYASQYPGLQGNPLAHYLHTGWREGASPHPLFDVAHYRAQRPGVDREPVADYLTNGRAAGVSPQRLFDAPFYLSQRADVVNSGADPFIHYIVFGWAEGVRPHWLFDPAHYRANDDIGEPLAHYLGGGWRSGRAPHPLVEPAYYRAQLGRPVEVPDVFDYLDHGHQHDASPTPLFDEPWYRATYMKGAPGPALMHYLALGSWHMDAPHPVFDVHHYRAQAPGVTGMDLDHYAREGEAQGLRPNPLFSPIFYRSMTPPFPGLALAHYLREGEGRGLPASPEFRVRRYVSRHLSYATDRRALRHYMLAGRPALPAPPAFPFLAAPPVGPERAAQVVVVLLGPRDAEAQAEQYAALGVVMSGAEPRGKKPVRWMAGWVVALPSMAALPGWAAAQKGAMSALPVVLLAGAAVMAADDILALAREAPAYPILLDRAHDVVHAGYAVADGVATPRGVGADPQHPAVSVTYAGPTAGPVLAVPMATLATRPPEFLALSEDARCVPGPVAIQLDAVVGAPPPAPMPFPGARHKARPRALLIDSIVPREAFDAGSYYALQLMETYQGFGYDVTFVPDAEFAGPAEHVRAVAARGITIIQAPFAPDTASYIAGIDDAFEVVVMSRYNCGGRHLEALMARWPAARLVFHPGDLHHLREIREAVHRESVEGFAAALATKRRELAIAAAADCTVVVSDHELQVLHDAGLGERAVRIDPEYTNRAPAPYDPATRAGVAFIGGYGHIPNVDAVEFLCETIWPLVTQARPGTVLHVVGSNPPPHFGRYASDDVRIEGRVEDLDTMLDGLRLTVAPLRFGAGVKMKIVSSLAAGVPVVCTPLAAEGIGLGGAGLVLAAGGQATAQAIVALYDDPARLRALSAAGFAAVHDRFSASAVRAAYRAQVGVA